ncbi:MAG TPA: HAMP domain-containing histidine kinase [Calditrichaeota bacterium]|nr:HAMP domain-containing histidine kinase [Calditrichota bacterium]
MRQFFRTLYGKISLIFLLLIFSVGTIEVFISVRSSVNYVCETSQKLNYTLARDLAHRFEPMLKDSLDYAAINNTIKDLMVMNPRVDIYIVDKHGHLLAYFEKPGKIQRKMINIEPVQEFVKESSYSTLPIFGDDPLHESRRKVFSAAPVTIGKKGKGYLYVILASARYELAAEGIRGSYILKTSAIALSTILIFGAVVGLVFFFFVTKRLHRVTRTVRDFERGDYNQRLSVDSDDEVSELAAAFNRMADTIQKNIRDLEKNAILRRELIANISHDLRSPLASIQGYIETVLMKDDQLMPEERKSYLVTILKNVTNLNQLVHELFDLSKFDAKQTQPHFEPFSIADLTQDVALKFQPIAEDKGIHLLTKLPVNLPFVYGDIGMIERVLSNLIDNALRYTKAEGKVTIQLEKKEDAVCINVSDTGAGIPEEDLPYVFERFYRVEKSRTRNSADGSGLGLAIAKKIIEAHNSTIRVQSKLNGGTVFSFKLKIYRHEKDKKKKNYVQI